VVVKSGAISRSRTPTAVSEYAANAPVLGEPSFKVKCPP
jgi:hypothetical protein